MMTADRPTRSEIFKGSEISLNFASFFFMISKLKSARGSQERKSGREGARTSRLIQNVLQKDYGSFTSGHALNSTRQIPPSPPPSPSPSLSCTFTIPKSM